MSNDDRQRIIYDMRANSLRDKVSELDEAEKKGKIKGKIESAKGLLNILDDETISRSIGLELEIVKKLRTENSNRK